jgi:hypothetical protein
MRNPGEDDDEEFSTVGEMLSMFKLGYRCEVSPELERLWSKRERERRSTTSKDVKEAKRAAAVFYRGVIDELLTLSGARGPRRCACGREVRLLPGDRPVQLTVDGMIHTCSGKKREP